MKVFHGLQALVDGYPEILDDFHYGFIYATDADTAEALLTCEFRCTAIQAEEDVWEEGDEFWCFFRTRHL